MVRPTILLLVVVLLGCGQPKVVSSGMSQNERNSLSTALAKLDATLLDKTPLVADALAPPATDAELETLWSEFSGAKVECLEVWYRWHNGCTSRTIDVLPLGRVLSIEEAVDDRQQIQSVPFVDAKRRSAVKILEDGSGDGYFLDVTSPSPRVFYHMLEDPFPRYYGSLAEFVDFIESIHAAGLASRNEHGMVSFDLERYQEMKSEYLQTVGNE